jgi:hypothetical protein|tara:strand:- start:242 stop:553 length:312 start_codon:yes stop_codon:yes gene_type:complete
VKIEIARPWAGRIEMQRKLNELDADAARLQSVVDASQGFIILIEKTKIRLNRSSAAAMDDLIDGLKDCLTDSVYLALAEVEEEIHEIEARAEREHEQSLGGVA